MSKIPFPPAAYAKEAEDTATEILIPPVSALFKTRWGSKWPQEVKERMVRVDAAIRAKRPGFRGRSHLVIENGQAKFELATLMHALRDNVDELESLSKSATQIKALCKAITDYRNSQSHKDDPEIRHEVGPAILQIKDLIKLIEIIVGESGVERLKVYLNELRNRDKPEQPAPDDNTEASQWQAINEMREMLKSLVERTAPAPPAANPPPIEPIAPKPTPGAGGTSSLEIRSTPIPTPRQGAVVFPIVGNHEYPPNQLGYFLSKFYEPGPRGQRILAIIIAFDQKNDIFTNIVNGARNDEPDAARSTMHTRTRVDPQRFAGLSYGLAAALADKSARYDWSDQARHRMIVATGVLREGSGTVELVTGFLAKLQLIEREVSDDAIFVYPKLNHDNATPDERALLDGLAKTKRIRLIPVRHISELDHLFDLAEPDIPNTAPKLTVSPAAAPAGETGPASTAGRFRPSMAKAGWVVSIATAVLVALFLAGKYAELNRLSPEQAQRIADLVNAQSGRPASNLSARECTELVRAARLISDIDRQRLNPSASAAVAEAASCSRRLADSDAKLSKLAEAGQKIGSYGVSMAGCTPLMSAADKLDSFDRDQMNVDQKQALSYQTACKSILAESDKRLADIIRKASLVTLADGDLSACESLVAATHLLSADDGARFRSNAADAFAKVGPCTSQIQNSDARIRGFINATDGFAPSNVGSVEALVSARTALQTADIGRLDTAKRDGLLAITAKASDLLRQSDARIGVFLSSYAEWKRSPTAINFDTFDRSGQLTDFDRSRPNVPDLRDAQAALIAVRKEARARADRWTLVERLTVTASRQTPADYWRPLSEAVSRLSPQDKDAATPDQQRTLDRANGLLALGSRRSSPEDDFGTVPAPKPPPNLLQGYQRPPAIADDFGTVRSNPSPNFERR